MQWTHTQRFFYYYSFSVTDLALKKTLELNIAELWTDLDSDLSVEDSPCLFLFAAIRKFFLICFSLLAYQQGKRF